MSLGINLLSKNGKICNFNCIYCECGLTPFLQPGTSAMPSQKEVKLLLEERLKRAVAEGEKIDTITFAGNGEPTLHPDFNAIIDDTLKVRSEYLPDARIAVLSNATLIADEKVFSSLTKIDLNILKLDTVIEKTLRIINCPNDRFSLTETIGNLRKFSGNLIIQTLFLRGVYNNEPVDNTLPSEVEPWLEAIKQIQPACVMIYTIARDTPLKNLNRISRQKLLGIADKVNKLGIETQVSA